MVPNIFWDKVFTRVARCGCFVEFENECLAIHAVHMRKIRFTDLPVTFLHQKLDKKTNIIPKISFYRKVFSMSYQFAGLQQSGSLLTNEK